MKHPIKRMFAAAKKANDLELYLYSEIGENWYGDGVTPDSVQKAIKDAGDISTITVHVNSPGGASFDGVAIHNILRQQKVPVNVIVEGLAASAAFTVAMAGDTIQVCDGAMMMLHNAWSIAIGDAGDMRSMADLLDKVSGTLRDVYSKRSGLSAEDVQLLMDAETWLTAEEAVSKGFATEKLDTTPEKADAAQALTAQFDLKKLGFKNIPEAYNTQAKSEPQADEDCQCDCAQCVAGDCEKCSNPACDDPNCEGSQGEPSSEVAPPEQDVAAVDTRSRRLQLLEMTQPGA